MEVARVLGTKSQTDWKPRRTIMFFRLVLLYTCSDNIFQHKTNLKCLFYDFCSWVAEEYGLIGSREFVEQYTPALVERAVAYLNTDICVSNNASILAPHVAPVLK